jgi:hypothetical protein
MTLTDAKDRSSQSVYFSAKRLRRPLRKTLPPPRHLDLPPRQLTVFQGKKNSDERARCIGVRRKTQ